MNDHDALCALLRQRSVTFGDFILSSGQQSHYYVDARKTTMSAEGLRLIGRLGLRRIRERGWTADVIGGLTLGADPVAYAVARASVDEPPVIDAFSVRKATKEHGTKRRIEGNFGVGSRVIVAEDVMTTGGSAIQAIETIRAEGGAIVGVLAVVDRDEGGSSAILALGVPTIFLTTISELGVRQRGTGA